MADVLGTLVYLFFIQLSGFFFPLKARSVFVQRGLRVERLCKAVVGGGGLSCLTLVILGLFPTSEEAVGYFLIIFLIFWIPCVTCVRVTRSSVSLVLAQGDSACADRALQPRGGLGRRLRVLRPVAPPRRPPRRLLQ